MTQLLNDFVINFYVAVMPAIPVPATPYIRRFMPMCQVKKALGTNKYIRIGINTQVEIFLILHVRKICQNSLASGIDCHAGAFVQVIGVDETQTDSRCHTD